MSLRGNFLSLLEQQQQVGVTAVVTINNREGGTEQTAYQSHLPAYTATFENPYDKPPSYEQTVQQLSSVNHTLENPGHSSVTPAETIQRVPSSRHQT